VTDTCSAYPSWPTRPGLPSPRDRFHETPFRPKSFRANWYLVIMTKISSKNCWYTHFIFLWLWSRVAKFFFGTTYLNGKNLPKWLQNISTKYSKWHWSRPKGQKITYIFVARHSKIYPSGFFWFETIPSVNPATKYKFLGSTCTY
jgi:hypothetical protein